MRKISIVVLLVPVLIFIAASSNGAQKATDQPVKLAPVSIATGPAGGTLQIQGGVIADIANGFVEGSPFGIVAGGSVTNITVVHKRESGIGLTLSNFLTMATKAEGPFEKQTPYKNLKALFTTLMPVFAIGVNPNIKSKSFAELIKNKEKISVGGATPASPSYWIFNDIVGFYGSSLAGMRAWGCEIMLQSVGENVSSWKDGRSDLIYTIQSLPAAMLVEGFSARKGIIWDVPEPVRDFLVTRGFSKADIPAETYSGIDKIHKSIGAPYVWFAHDNLSVEAAYFFTKAAAENQDRLAATVSKEFKTGWNPKQMIVGAPIEFHDGAKRYFIERGWMK